MVERLKESNDHSIGKASSESDNGYEEIAQSLFERAKSENLSPEDVIREIWRRHLDPSSHITLEVRNKLMLAYLNSLPKEIEEALTAPDTLGKSRISMIVAEEVDRAKRVQRVTPISEVQGYPEQQPRIETKERKERVSRGMAKHIRTIKSQSHH
ncbi:MAG: hypothetical protein Q8Q24_01895 [bacterium]|nr:hypothetical protein [bacterium]